MRPLFYGDMDMKHGLNSSNFKVYYETYLNPLHPYYNGGVIDRGVKYQGSFPTSGLSIFDYAMIADRTTGQTIKDNDKLTPGNISRLSKYIMLISVL